MIKESKKEADTADASDNNDKDNKEEEEEEEEKPKGASSLLKKRPIAKSSLSSAPAKSALSKPTAPAVKAPEKPAIASTLNKKPLCGGIIKKPGGGLAASLAKIKN